MASLYYLISAILQREDTTTTTEASSFTAIHPYDEPSSLAGLLQQPNATMEELWVALFQTRMDHNHNAGGPDDILVLAAASNSNSNSNVSLFLQLPAVFGVLLPWLLAVILGIVLPCVALLRELYKRGVYVSERKRRKKELLKCLEEFQKVLTPRDWVDPKKHDDSDIDNDNDVGTRWKLPLAGVPLPLPLLSSSQSETKRGDALLLERHVAGNCVICLTQYTCGETLTWSSNPKCVHCFHQDCIVSWLSKRRNREQKPCPCCRQSFVVGTVVTTKIPK